MFIGLSLEAEQETRRFSQQLDRLESRLASFFEGRSYGTSIQHLFIGVILTHPSGAQLHPVRPLRLQKSYTYRSPATKSMVTIERLATYDVLPDFEAIVAMTDAEAERHLARTLVTSTGVLTAARRRLADFDVEAFVADFRTCLEGA